MLINAVNNICFFEITNFKTNLFIPFRFTSYLESLILFFSIFSVMIVSFGSWFCAVMRLRLKEVI